MTSWSSTCSCSCQARRGHGSSSSTPTASEAGPISAQSSSGISKVPTLDQVTLGIFPIASRGRTRPSASTSNASSRSGANSSTSRSECQQCLHLRHHLRGTSQRAQARGPTNDAGAAGRRQTCSFVLTLLT
jgi:hypothetical protein